MIKTYGRNSQEINGFSVDNHCLSAFICVENEACLDIDRQIRTPHVLLFNHTTSCFMFYGEHA